MKALPSKTTYLSLVLVLSIALSACGINAAETTPTLALDVLQTQIAATVSAQLAETALHLPTATLISISTNAPAPTIFVPATVLPPVASPTGRTIASCYSLVYSKDVTIPDNTSMTPGQSFTKTWEVYNNGTCKWEDGFKLSLSSGDGMSGETLKVTMVVEPNKKIELSVNMVAPNKAGKFTGVWRLKDVNGNFFGDPLTVVIQVAGKTQTATPTKGTVTATFTNLPATLTFTVVPPTATLTLVQPTVTFSPVPITATLAVQPTAAFTVTPTAVP